MNEGNISVLTSPLDESDIVDLKAGDLIKINGEIITARDKAYSRILELSNNEKKLPANLQGKIIYHCGPLARKTNGEWEIISAGPTTSARLDDSQIEFVESTKVRALIGKGGVSREVAEKLSELGCIYLAFTGGAGALAASSIESVEDILWEDLGMAEAVWILKAKDFGPLVVAIDAEGKNLYHKR